MMELKKKKFKPGSSGLLELLSPWLADDTVSEILINQPYQVWIETKGVMSCYKIPDISPLYLKRLFTFIANENGKVIDEACPILSGNLYYDARVQLVIPPASRHYCLSIRKQTKKSCSLDDFNQSDFFNNAKPFSLNVSQVEDHKAQEMLLSLYRTKSWMLFLLKAVEEKKNIIISGATSSGKTSLLNACLTAIPQGERIITLEDTFEISIPHPNKVSLLAQKDKNNYSMQCLLQCVLRLRPDRILMGEIRGPEVLDFIGACQTGHSGAITTIHANNPKGVITRMTQLYKQNNVPSMRDKDIDAEILDVIDIIVQLERKGDRRHMSYIYYKEAA
jgi:type IV secretion system protein VirB11